MLADFLASISGVLSRAPTPQQREAIEAPPHAVLFLVAGPGSGKTAVLALRALKLIIVDHADPSGVVATTFTKRAAKELRSRILGWGDRLRSDLLTRSIDPGELDRLRSLDFNAILTGTLDSLCQTIMGQFRRPGTQPPPVIEAFVSDALLLRKGLFPAGRLGDSELEDYLRTIRGSGGGRLSASAKVSTIQQLYQRTVHDDVDMGAWGTAPGPCGVCGTHPHGGVGTASDVINDYEAHLATSQFVDYPNLERRFLEQLRAGMPEFTDGLRHVLVDEYQDTNYLQEQIYFELGRCARGGGGGISVVGDDDQSMYRFRGASVELFQAFPSRIATALGVAAQTIYLVENFRSTNRVVEFCNDFVQLDPLFQDARVAGKPAIRFARNVTHNPPILGMFRPTTADLAHDLARVISDVFQGAGLTMGRTPDIVRRDPTDGSLLDVALLTFSPAEQTTSRTRLPGALRAELRGLPSPIEVFNPRGQPLREVDSVRLLCGLILECVDPGATRQAAIPRLPVQAGATLTAWRQRAQRRLRETSADTPELRRFVSGWASRRGAGGWPRELGLAELAYKLVSWIPAMQDDPEGLVHLEVVQRTISQAGRFSSYGGTVVFRAGVEDASIKDAIWSIFVPLAEGAVEVDEDLREAFPADRLNILSIHQAKGLQFPLTIVDVGSDFGRPHPSQAFKRFPTGGSEAHRLEDELLQFSRSLIPPARSQVDRAFDDLVRAYFVAFSRAQDVLLLVGNDRIVTDVPSPVRNIATGWDRSSRWVWGAGLPNLSLL